MGSYQIVSSMRRFFSMNILKVAAIVFSFFFAFTSLSGAHSASDSLAPLVKRLMPSVVIPIGRLNVERVMPKMVQCWKKYSMKAMQVTAWRA